MGRSAFPKWISSILMAIFCGAGCQNMPQRRVPPEPPYSARSQTGELTGVGFSSEPPPAIGPAPMMTFDPGSGRPLGAGLEEPGGPQGAGLPENPFELTKP